MSSVEFIDNSQAVFSEMDSKIQSALNAVGQQAEGHAKTYIESDPRRHKTGRLMNSITHTYKKTGELKGEVTIGTNVEYAVYVHEGTGDYATGGSGAKKIPWAFIGEDGKWHWTRGMKPNRFLKKAIQNHITEYKNIVESFLGK